jgi:hypothetical protein
VVRTPTPRSDKSMMPDEYLYDGISVLRLEPGQVLFFAIIDGIEELCLNINSYSIVNS